MAVGISSIVSEGALASQSASLVFVTLSHTNQLTQAGVYRLRAYVSMYGTAPAAGDAGNVLLKVGAASQVLAVPAVAGSPNAPYQFMLTLDGSTDVTLVSGANVPTATYSGMLVADFCGSNGQLAKFLPS